MLKIISVCSRFAENPTFSEEIVCYLPEKVGNFPKMKSKK
jgi:hypothetical protein